MALRLTLLMAVALATPGALAATAPLQLDAVVSQQNQIRADVLAGNGRYKYMPKETKDELLQRQGKLLQVIGGKHDAGELSREERLQAFNTLEWIEAAINNDPSERTECMRERRTGSMRTVTVCKTQRQMDEDRERAQGQMLGTVPIDI